MNTITITENGPLHVVGTLIVRNAAGDVVSEEGDLWFCRCGGSSGKPFCDGAHNANGFADAGMVTAPPPGGDAETDGTLEITLLPNGAMRLNGPHQVVDAQGTAHPPRDKGALCRCGASENKPYCDASHNRIGFTD